MLMHVKVSKDNQREVHLCFEDYDWLQKDYNKGKLEKTIYFATEEEAFEYYNETNIGETY